MKVIPFPIDKARLSLRQMREKDIEFMRHRLFEHGVESEVIDQIDGLLVELMEMVIESYQECLEGR
jgi:hypothetical protein